MKIVNKIKKKEYTEKNQKSKYKEKILDILFLYFIWLQIKDILQHSLLSRKNIYLEKRKENDMKDITNLSNFEKQ